MGTGVGAGGADVGAGGADVATDGLGETGAADGGAADGVAVGELVVVDVAAVPQPPTANVKATMTKARRGFIVRAFRQEPDGADSVVRLGIMLARRTAYKRRSSTVAQRMI